MRVYLDHHAASPVAPEVLEAMREAREVAWANPSSAHGAGRAARAVIERARERVAAAIGAAPSDLVFTAGGTEACNLGVLGLSAQRILVTAIEHPAVLEAARAHGAQVVELAVPEGRAPGELPLEGVDLVCAQWVNHETGTVLPVERWAAQCRAAGVALFVDASQALGKLPVDVAGLGARAVAFAASKLGGPPGAGALWIARDTELAPRAVGGAQERGRRAGSPDPAALAGFGRAASLVPERLVAMDGVAARRDRLEAAVSRWGEVNAGGAPRVATVINLSVRGWSGPRLVAALDVEGLEASHGAACSSGVDAPSAVVAAMYPEEPGRAESALRLSLGPTTTDADVDRAVELFERVARRKSG